MRIFRKMIERISVYYTSDEKDKVFGKLFKEGYHTIYSGPVVKKFKVVKNSYKIVATKELKNE